MLTFHEYLREQTMPVFNPLKITDLRKDENRVLAFIRKVKDKDEFATVNRGMAIINADELSAVSDFLTADSNRFPKNNTSLQVNTNKGTMTVPKDFLKTTEFGGRGQGSGVAAETQAMNYFNEKLETILQKEGLAEIKIRINGRIIKCAAMVKTEGSYQGTEPKSDMTLVDVKGTPQAFISHKAGRTAKDYQQYGGLSNKALPVAYQNNTEVKQFMKDVNKLRPDGLKSGDSIFRPVKDAKLIRMMMYGPEYGGNPSISNVDEFHLGNMILKGTGAGPYTIESIHKGTNGDIPRGEFEAVLFIRYQARRGDARAVGEVVKNARVGVFPIAKISGTSIKI